VDRDSAWMAALAIDLSESLVPIALGLAVAIVASALYQCLQAQLSAFDIEMHHAARYYIAIIPRPPNNATLSFHGHQPHRPAASPYSSLPCATGGLLIFRKSH
jgi:hypothetical protein